jgi:hypothetical protein
LALAHVFISTRLSAVICARNTSGDCGGFLAGCTLDVSTACPAVEGICQ